MTTMTLHVTDRSVIGHLAVWYCIELSFVIIRIGYNWGGGGYTGSWVTRVESCLSIGFGYT